MKFNPIAQSSLAVLSLLFVPIQSFAVSTSAAPAAPYCVAVNGGFGNSGYTGSTYVARNFLMPQVNKCSPWAGYTLTNTTVIFTTTGTACVSSDGLALTIAVTSQDPDYLGFGVQAVDYIKLARTSRSEPYNTGSDIGYLTGSVEQTTCTNELLTLPAIHD